MEETQSNIQEQLENLTTSINNVQLTLNDTSAQLDTDRQDIDKMKVEQATIMRQQEVLLDNFRDFNSVIKQTVKDCIKGEVAKSIKKELNKIILENPDKILIVEQSFWEWVWNLVKRKQYE